MFTLVFTPKKNFAFAVSTISILFFVLSIFTYYSSVTENAVATEDIVVERIWSLIDSARAHVNQTSKAIESGNSTVALGLLAEIRKDLNNINGNVTDLIFAVSKTPP